MKWNLESIQIAFSNMEQEGWNIQSKLKWGFTFFGTTKKELLNVYKELKDFDYTIEQLEFRADLKLWILQVIKMEELNVEKLHRRNIAFENLAIYHGIDSYDGWNVEKVKER